MRGVGIKGEMAGDGERAYFAAANSGKGFVSFFEELFFGDGIKERYIIKGGPGTGKSSFMRRAALRAKARGRQTELYYCSSDPSSLDGVVIDGRIAFIDGTAPHSYDTVLPGACDRIVDLGAFWDADILRERAEEIRTLGKVKKDAYSRAYGYLGSALALRNATDKLLSGCVTHQKLIGAASRCAERLGVGNCRGILRTCQTQAHGVSGLVSLPTLWEIAQIRHAVEDYYGTAYLFLGALAEDARANGCEVWVSRDTVDTERLCQVFFPHTGELFYITAEGKEQPECEGKIINMKRFVDASSLSLVRREARAAKGAYDTLISLASSALRDAGAAHMALEDIYVPSMDFSTQRGFCDRLLDGIDM